MSTFFDRLAAEARGEGEAVSPRARARFETEELVEEVPTTGVDSGDSTQARAASETPSAPEHDPHARHADPLEPAEIAQPAARDERMPSRDPDRDLEPTEHESVPRAVAPDSAPPVRAPPPEPVPTPPARVVVEPPRRPVRSNPDATSVERRVEVRDERTVEREVQVPEASPRLETPARPRWSEAPGPAPRAGDDVRDASSPRTGDEARPRPRAADPPDAPAALPPQAAGSEEPAVPPPPSVRIRIGRVEVHAAHPRRHGRDKAPAAREESALARYLKQRNEGTW